MRNFAIPTNDTMTPDQYLDRAVYAQGLPDLDTLTEHQYNVYNALCKACKDGNTDSISDLNSIVCAMPRELRTGPGPVKKALNTLVQQGFVKTEPGYGYAGKTLTYYKPQPAQ